MTDTASREVPTAPPPFLARLALRGAGVLLVVLGGALAVYMTIAMFHEIMGDDFYGMGVCLLVVTFGGLMVRDGLRLAAGKRVDRKYGEPTPYHRALYAPALGHPKGVPADPARCAMTVLHNWQCGSPRGHGPAEAYCYKHANEIARDAAGEA